MSLWRWWKYNNKKWKTTRIKTAIGTRKTFPLCGYLNLFCYTSAGYILPLKSPISKLWFHPYKRIWNWHMPVTKQWYILLTQIFLNLTYIWNVIDTLNDILQTNSSWISFSFDFSSLNIFQTKEKHFSFFSFNGCF